MFALAQPTDEAIEQGLGRIQDIRPGAGVAVLASDDSFGRAARAGALRQLSASGHEILADVSFARGIDDYRTALNWLREREAGIIVLGALAEEALAIMRTARAMRWNPTFLCPSTCYTPEFAATGGEVTAGLYTVGDVPIPYATDPYLRDWSQRFEEKYGEPPSLQALAGYRNTSLFLAVLERTGRTTTRQSFRNALEVLGPWDDPANEGAAIYFSAEDHTARQSGFLAQARNGRWVIIEEASPTRL
jgi:ABC-type branched-subunit amino acid transport system substrate-binding protein